MKTKSYAVIFVLAHLCDFFNLSFFNLHEFISAKFSIPTSDNQQYST
jgi:hypothetical protein